MGKINLYVNKDLKKKLECIRREVLDDGLEFETDMQLICYIINERADLGSIWLDDFKLAFALMRNFKKDKTLG